MSKQRYNVKHEEIPKSLIETFIETGPLETRKAVRVTITVQSSGESVEGIGADYDQALDRACRKLGISRREL